MAAVIAKEEKEEGGKHFSFNICEAFSTSSTFPNLYW